MENLYRLFNKERLDEILSKGTDQYYLRFPIKKSSGKKRWIAAPIDELKEMQNTILHFFLYRMEPHECATGFSPGSSLTRGAERHLNHKALLNIDLKDFFDSIEESKVIKMFYWISGDLDRRNLFPEMSKEEKKALAKLCTYRGAVPQGAPTSPAISNLVSIPMDREINSYCLNNDLVYTRYADDMTFSKKDGKINMVEVYNDILGIIKKYKFVVNKDKTRIQRHHQRMTVTGVVVNDKLGIPKWKRKNFRAKLHNLEKSGKPITEFEQQQLIGYAQWVHQLDKNKGEKFLEQIGRINCSKQ